MEKPKIDRVEVKREVDGQFAVGVVAYATVSYPLEPPKRGLWSYRLQGFESAGLYGIQDGDEAYLQEVEAEQLADLKEHLQRFGVDVSDWKGAIEMTHTMTEEIEHQERAGRLVGRWVLGNVGCLVEPWFQVGEGDIYDWLMEALEEAEAENRVELDICLRCGETDVLGCVDEVEGEAVVQTSMLRDLGEDPYDYPYDECKLGICFDCSDQYDEDSARPEVFEWWAVDPWLGSKLKERGCVVADLGGLTVWGRECTGQAIKLDDDIQEIALELDWTKED